MEQVITTGMSDSALYMQAVANVASPFTVDGRSGNYPLVGNTLVNRRLANSWLVNSLIQRAFVDGMGVTSVGADAEGVAMLRVPIMMMPPRLKRTLGAKMCRSDSEGGTLGNNLPFNRNLPHGVATDGVDIPFTQVYDEAMQISKTTMRLMGSNLDALQKYSSEVPKTAGMLQDADIMATHIGSALSYANTHGNSNIIAYNSATTTEGYMQSIMNELASKLANVKGAYAEGIVSYPAEKSVYVMRWSFFNKLKTINNGAIVNSDIGQKILLNGYLDESGERLLGNYIYGKYNGIYIKVLPDELFDTAAASLDIAVGTGYTNYNKVVAYIANAEGTYFGQSSADIEIEKSPTTSMGFILRTDWGWGVANVRPSSIALVVESTNNLADFTNPVPTFNGIVSPANIEGRIAEYQSAEPDTSMVQRVAAATLSMLTKVQVTVRPSGSSSTTINNAEVVARLADGSYASVSDGGAGIYSFTMPRATTALIAVSATGYNNNTATVSASDSAGENATKTVSLTTA